MEMSETQDVVTPYGVIYVVTNSVTKKVYVGQTVQKLSRRWAQHRRSGVKITRTSGLLARSIGKYGSDVFTVQAVDVAISEADLDQKEIDWILRLGSLTPNGYNLKAGGNGGGRPSIETIERLRQSHRGKKQPPEQIEKRAAALRGRKHPARSAKLILSWQGRERIFSDDLRERMSLSHKGHQASEETKSKMKAAQAARRERELAAGIEQVWTDASREALRQAHLGKKHSEETRAKMRASHARRLFALNIENEDSNES